MRRFYFPAAILLAACSFFACARQGTPTGGPKDSTPPQLDSVASTPNFSIRFNANRIQLSFDEWIVLKDAPTQVLISPPLNKRPDISLKGKTVTVKFAEGEILRPNTTYTVNFGSSVQDLHEGNPAKDLRFVFSTGDYIDSLTLSGAVVDAFTGDPVENVSVMLYENLEDSVARKEKPFYLAKADKNGLFSIQNVKSGRFKMLAYDDKDGNLKWSGDSESIAFADTAVGVTPASARRFTTLRLFKDQARFRLFERNANRYGLVKLIYTGPPDSIPLRVEPEVPGLRLLAEKSLDTLLVWYDLPTPTGWQLLAGGDTVAVRDLARDDFFKGYRLGFLQESGAANRGATGGKFNKPVVATTPTPVKPPPNVNQNPARPGFLDFTTPIVSVDTSKWRLTLDSSGTVAFSARPDSAAPRRVNIILPWQAGRVYQLLLLPGAVTDFYGFRNSDTLRVSYTVLSEKQLGGLNLTVNTLRPGTSYVLQLLNGKEIVETRRFTAELPEKRLTFGNLLTAAYTVQLIEDRNNNGQWDTGDYYARRQPERIFTKKLEALRANWEVETTMEATARSSASKVEKKKTN